jgi:N-acetylglutamate synthase-like GNAT family acetyltransferase
MGGTTVRRASTADTESARGLLRELGYAGIDEAAFALGFAAVLADPLQSVWLAEQEGRVVGLMSLSWRPQVRIAGLIMTIDELVVTEGARGSGLGAKLLEIAKDEATRVGARRLELLTARSRPSYKRGFYLKNGFTEVDSAVMRWEGGVSAVVR